MSIIKDVLSTLECMDREECFSSKVYFVVDGELDTDLFKRNELFDPDTDKVYKKINHDVQLVYVGKPTRCMDAEDIIEAVINTKHTCKVFFGGGCINVRTTVDMITALSAMDLVRTHYNEEDEATL